MLTDFKQKHFDHKEKAMLIFILESSLHLFAFYILNMCVCVYWKLNIAVEMEIFCTSYNKGENTEQENKRKQNAGTIKI